MPPLYQKERKIMANIIKIKRGVLYGQMDCVFDQPKRPT